MIPFKSRRPSSGSLKFRPKKPAEKPKKVPRSKPKLTLDLLLSDDSLGFVLSYFLWTFKYHGHGSEVRVSFEQVATTKLVKITLREWKERVANGKRSKSMG